MPQPLAAAAEIETKIAKILSHQAVKVKPYGRHLLIQIDDNGQLLGAGQNGPISAGQK
jgi:hypothetical protein